MIYLNSMDVEPRPAAAAAGASGAAEAAEGCFCGGPTTFFSQKQEHYVVGERANALCDYQPQAGSILARPRPTRACSPARRRAPRVWSSLGKLRPSGLSTRWPLIHGSGVHTRVSQSGREPVRAVL